MKLSIVAGATSQSVNVFIRDSSSTTGAGLAAVAPAGGALLSGTKLYYSFSGANASAGVAVSLAVLAAVNSAWSSAGIVTLDGTNMIGWVRIDIPNAALAASKGRSVSFLLFGGTNMAPTPFEIELTGWDNQDGVRGGLTALPNAAAEAAGGLYTRGTGAGQIKQTNNGEIDSNSTRVNNVSTGSVTTINANQGTTQPVNFTGTAGSALVKTDMIDVNGVAYGSSTLNTLASHDPGATLGTSTLTQTQVTGGAYSVQSASCVLGDARVAHLDADVSSRMATFTLPTNFAALGITGGGHVSNVDTLTTYTGNTVQTGDAYARLGAPAGASVSADIAEIEVETDTLLAGVIVTTNNDKTGYGLTGAYDFAKGTVAMTESYAALHAAPTPVQALFEIVQTLVERSIKGTTLTVKKTDGATTALTATLDSATAPTSQTRAT